MTRVGIAWCIVGFVASSALAQQPVTPLRQVPPNVQTSQGSVAPTAEMWFYEQELRQRYSPELAVRRKAEFETQQMQNRIAAREWFGASLARPMAGVTPFTGDYSPSWTSNSRNPFHWSGASGGTTVIIPSARPMYIVR